MNIRSLLLFLLLTLILGVGSVHAQYRTAIGIRLGTPWALSLKHFLSEENAIEVYAGARFLSNYRFTSISAAYLFHSPIEIDGIEGLQWYVGGGASAYLWTYDASINSENFASTSFGVQGYLGLDWYPSEDIPVAFSLDWVPSLFIGDNLYIGFRSFRAYSGNLGIRYIIGT